MLVNNKIGFMQGRLTEKGGFKPQEFPQENWIQELYLAETLGFDCVEWMFNENEWKYNPIILNEALKKIINVYQDVNIRVSGICANYFMNISIYEREKAEENIFILNTLLHSADMIGCKNIIIPMFDASELQLDNTYIYGMIDELSYNDIYILFESNNCLSVLQKWISGFTRDHVGICYDIGNAIGMGYNPADELRRYGDIVKNVHLKDKKTGGNTVMLGDGAADFKTCFQVLENLSYDGCYILESYYENAIRDTCRNLNYIKEIIK